MSNVPVAVVRKEVLDLRRHEFIDMVLPTIEVKRSNIVHSLGLTAVLGSHRVGPGSLFRLLEIEVASGSNNTIIGAASTGTPITPQEQRGTSQTWTTHKTIAPNHQVYRWDNAPTFGVGTLNFRNVSGAVGSPFVSISFRGYEYSLAQGISTV